MINVNKSEVMVFSKEIVDGTLGLSTLMVTTKKLIPLHHDMKCTYFAWAYEELVHM